MNIHKNARLTLRRRRELVEHVAAGYPVKCAARECAISARTARKWCARYRDEGCPA